MEKAPSRYNISEDQKNKVANWELFMNYFIEETKRGDWGGHSRRGSLARRATRRGERPGPPLGVPLCVHLAPENLRFIRRT